MKAKFSIGDKVKIVGYGHPLWISKGSNMKPDWPVIEENEKMTYYDILPGIVGQEGVVKKVSSSIDFHSYSLSGISEKAAWYNEDQLELINK